MTEADLLARMDALRVDAAKCNARAGFSAKKQPKPQKSNDNILAMLRLLSKGPVKVADAAAIMPAGQRSINSRLFHMVERGIAERISFGVYAITDKGRETLAKVAG